MKSVITFGGRFLMTTDGMLSTPLDVLFGRFLMMVAIDLGDVKYRSMVASEGHVVL